MTCFLYMLIIIERSDQVPSGRSLKQGERQQRQVNPGRGRRVIPVPPYSWSSFPSPRKPQCSFWFLPLWDFEEEKRRSSFFIGVCCLRIEKLLAPDEKCHINRSHTRRRDAAGQLHNLRSLSTSRDFILTYLDRGAVFTIWKVELRKEFQVHSRCHAI